MSEQTLYRQDVNGLSLLWCLFVESRLPAKNALDRTRRCHLSREGNCILLQIECLSIFLSIEAQHCRALFTNNMLRVRQHCEQHCGQYCQGELWAALWAVLSGRTVSSTMGSIGAALRAALSGSTARQHCQGELWAAL